MLDKTAINWVPVFLVLVLLILAGGGFFVNNLQDVKSGDQLQHHYKINNNLWLYITEDRNGDATNTIINRFYLTDEIIGDEKFITTKLKYEIPFLTGSGTISHVNVSDDYTVTITYSGKVYSLSNSVDYLLDGQQISAHLSYIIN